MIKTEGRVWRCSVYQRQLVSRSFPLMVSCETHRTSIPIDIATGLGPVAFGFLSQTKGFRYVNWVLFGMAVLVAIFTYFLLDETRASVLLTRKAKRLRKETGDERYLSKAEVEKTSLIEMWKTNLRRPVSLLCHEPVLISFTAWIG